MKPAVKNATMVTYEVERINEKWAMDDGAKLPVSVYYPILEEIGETFPVVIFMHPWLFDKTIYDDLAAEYASRGYVGLTFTVRGWFKAEGRINSLNPDCEMKDLSRIITLVARDRRFPVQKDAQGPVVGLTGYSLGAMQSYLAAPRANPRPGDPCDSRVRAIAPMHGGVDLVATHYPNGAGKMIWTALLLRGAYTGNILGVIPNLLSVIKDPNLTPRQKIAGAASTVTDFLKVPFNNVDSNLTSTIRIGLQRRLGDLETMRSFLKMRSAQFWCDEEMDGKAEHPITVPTLQVAGWKDDLFVPNQSLGMFNSMISAPNRLIITNQGHLGDSSSPMRIGKKTRPEQEWLEGQIQAWFDHFLKGVQNGIEPGPTISYYRDWDKSYGTSDRWPIAGTDDVVYNLGGSTGYRQGSLSMEADYNDKPDTLLNRGISGSISLPYFNDLLQTMGGPYLKIPEKINLVDIPLQQYNYVSQPLVSDTIIAGTPRIKLTYKSSNKFTQLNSRIYEVTADGRKKLISRGYYEGYDPETGKRLSTGEKPLEMTACCHQVAAGSRLSLEIKTADLIQVSPVRGRSQIDLFHDKPGASCLILPIAPE